MNRTSQDEALFTDAVEWIEHQLVESAVEYADGRVGWVSVGAEDSDTLTLNVTRSIYRGQLGISLFFAELHAIRGDERSARIAASAVRPWTSCEIDDLDVNYTGVATGLGSLIYTFSRLYTALGDDVYAEQARAATDYIDEQLLEADTAHDVTYGNAGLLLALLASEGIPPMTPETFARQVGDHLLETGIEQDDGLAWETSAGFRATGFAHGTAGIAYALLRLARRTGDDRFRRGAVAAIEFENTTYSEERGNWARSPDPESHGFSSGWCWGNPGIGLARSVCHDWLDEGGQDLATDARRALEHVGTCLRDEDSLCHGTFGDVAVLLEAGRRLDETYRSRARSLAVDAVHRWNREGRFQLPWTEYFIGGRPSMFLGYAGIGHTLLRLEHPETVPSVLLFE